MSERGGARDKASVPSFVLKGCATEEVGRALNDEGIAVRSGHHCARPILRRFGLEATVRPPLAYRNTCVERPLRSPIAAYAQAVILIDSADKRIEYASLTGRDVRS
ncbi:hypothetical protein WK81_27885 [Burkholderia ubonensis]|nr:hypothetical protein WK81_27885 [Burkholderia ubonensis]